MTSNHIENWLRRCTKIRSCVHHNHLEVVVGLSQLAVIKVYCEEERPADYGGIESQSVAWDSHPSRVARQLCNNRRPLAIKSWWKSIAACATSIHSLVHKRIGEIWCRVGRSRISDDYIEGILHFIRFIRQIHSDNPSLRAVWLCDPCILWLDSNLTRWI